MMAKLVLWVHAQMYVISPTFDVPWAVVQPSVLQSAAVLL